MPVANKDKLVLESPETSSSWEEHETYFLLNDSIGNWKFKEIVNRYYQNTDMMKYNP